MSVKGNLRKKRRMGNAKMNQEQIAACFALYRHGMSLTQIADAVWEKYGYASTSVAAICIRKAFYLNGYRLRSRSEACRLHKQKFYKTTARARGKDGKPTREYQREYYHRTRGELQERCIGHTAKGNPCQKPSQNGKLVCYAHDPDHAETRRKYAITFNLPPRQEAA
jgi:hypothetical protein